MKKIIMIALLVCFKQVNAQTCQAAFIYSLGSNGNTTFTSTSTGTTATTQYYWSWGDGSGEASAGPYNHTYSYNGTYTVSLSMTDSSIGCNSVVIDTILITSAAPCNIHASCTYSISPNGTTVTYSNTSTGNDGFCVTIFANQQFPNSNTIIDSTIVSGTGSGYGGTTVNYPYNGSYTATLTVSGGGCTSTFVDTVVISGQLTCSLSTSYTDTLRSNGQVDFYNTSTGVLSNMKSIWYFGDGTLSDTTNNASHNYAYNGTYHVTLFVKDSFNLCKDSVSKDITITNAPNTCTSSPSFSLLPDPSQAHAWFAVPNYSSQVINAIWTWGDGTSSTGLYPSHTYTAAGNYNICVKVYLACGDSATYCQTDTLSRNSSADQIIQISVVNHLMGIDKITHNSNAQLTIYPNPSDGVFTITSAGHDNNSKLTISIMDEQGRTILQKENYYLDDEINVSNLENGIYYVKIKSSTSEVAPQVKKLVLNR